MDTKPKITASTKSGGTQQSRSSDKEGHGHTPNQRAGMTLVENVTGSGRPPMVKKRRRKIRRRRPAPQKALKNLQTSTPLITQENVAQVSHPTTVATNGEWQSHV